MSTTGRHDRPVRILFVCSANRIRSPFAEAVARDLVAERHLPIEVSSAGFHEAGRRATTTIVEVAADTGLDLGRHISRQVDGELLGQADLVLAMTGEHVVDLVGLNPPTARRVLTLREAAAAAAGQGPPPWAPAETRAWAAAVSDRPLTAVLSGNHDTADPIGGSKRAYRRTAHEITELVGTLLRPCAAR